MQFSFECQGLVIKLSPLTEIMNCKKITFIEFPCNRLSTIQFVEDKKIMFPFKIFVLKPTLPPRKGDESTPSSYAHGHIYFLGL
jgi:hypothetical protein